MGKMEFPPETLAVSHTIAFHAVFAPRIFFFFSALQQSLRGRVGNFSGMWKKIEWCSNVRLLGRSKGSTHTYFFSHTRPLSHSRVSSYSTVWQSAFWETMTVRSQVVFWFKMTLILEFPKRHDFFLGKSRCSWQCTCQKKRCAWQTSWNPNFTSMESLQFPRFSKPFWHEVW